MTWTFYHNLNSVFYQNDLLTIRYYGIFFSLSILIGYLLYRFFFKKIYPSKEQILFFETYSFYFILLVILCARLTHVIFYAYPYYKENPIEIFFIWHGGIASHGFFIAFFIFFIFVVKAKKFNKLKISPLIFADLFFVFLLSTSFVRLGNFMNAEIVGSITSFPINVSYSFDNYKLPLNLVSYYKKRLIQDHDFRNLVFNEKVKKDYSLDNEKILNLLESPGSEANLRFFLSRAPRHLSQIYEFLFGIIAFFICFYFFKYRKLKAGSLVLLASLLYLMGRFLNEFFKEYQVFNGEYYLTMGQILSLFFMFFMLLFLSLYKRRLTFV